MRWTLTVTSAVISEGRGALKRPLMYLMPGGWRSERRQVGGGGREKKNKIDIMCVNVQYICMYSVCLPWGRASESRSRERERERDLAGGGGRRLDLATPVFHNTKSSFPHP